MAKACVSVLLPVRDAAETLVESLRTLSEQSLRNHEVIAVDDGSSDGSPAILRAFASADARFKVLSTPSRGIAAALNAALARAEGEYVARMDADDAAHPARLEVQVSRLARDPSIGILGCRVELFGDGNNAGMRRYVEWLNGLLDHDAIVGDIFVESPLAHPSVMMPRRTLLALGGYRDFGGPEDYDLWLRAHARGARFAKVSEVLLRWRDTPNRVSRRDPRYCPERFRELKLAALEDGLLRGSRGVVLWGAGKIGKGWSAALSKRGHSVLAFVEVNPRKIGQRIHDAPVLRPSEALIAGALHLAAVGQPGAREAIRAAASSLGLVEGRDLVAVA